MISFSRISKIHFVGIGGSGMSGIAEVLHNLGMAVTGSDLQESSTIRRLRRIGIKVFTGHDSGNLGDTEVLVYSSAVDRRTNPEVQAALAEKIPVIPRAEMLAELMRVKYSLAVAGTHGKTTTTFMIAHLLKTVAFDPTIVVGGKLEVDDAGGKLGASDYLVAEADESDGSFLQLLPTIAVINNIDDDHLDYYGSMRKLRRSFVDFANKVPFFGAVIAAVDCPNVRRILPYLNKRVITAGLHASAAVRGENVSCSAFCSSFDLFVAGRFRGRVRMGVGGLHNIRNALSAIGAALETGAECDAICNALADFYLPERRFQVLGQAAGITVIDDYAHHPTEIEAVLKTLRAGQFKRIIAVFQPHRYSRLQKLMHRFALSFSDADQVIIARLYSAGQDEIPQVNSRVLMERIRERGEVAVTCLETDGEITDFLRSMVSAGDALVFLSAGNLTFTAQETARMLQELKP